MAEKKVQRRSTLIFPPPSATLSQWRMRQTLTESLRILSTRAYHSRWGLPWLLGGPERYGADQEVEVLQGGTEEERLVMRMGDVTAVVPSIPAIHARVRRSQRELDNKGT